MCPPKGAPLSTQQADGPWHLLRIAKPRSRAQRIGSAYPDDLLRFSTTHPLSPGLELSARAVPRREWRCCGTVESRDLIPVGTARRGASQIWVKEIPPQCPYPPLPALKDRLVRFNPSLRDLFSIRLADGVQGPQKNTHPALRPRTVPPRVPYPMLKPSSRPSNDEGVISRPVKPGCTQRLKSASEAPWRVKNRVRTPREELSLHYEPLLITPAVERLTG